MTPRHLIVLAIVTASLSTGSVWADEAKSEFFEKQIRPVLVEHCYSCHSTNAENVRGGLLLDSKAGMVAGGDSGELLSAGKPEDSLLISALRHESFGMPPDRRLPDSIVEKFTTWIKDGAMDPREDGVVLEPHQIDMEEGRKFWSFQPITEPNVPNVGARWAKNKIDRFVVAEQTKSNLPVAIDAQADQMVRRLYFVLIGLPPTPQQIRGFEADWQLNPDEAIASLADELLASPRFGERWGRHWLDVVRFAESSGGGRSLMFPNAWRFREYVIRSFNDDKRIDQLIREHIAGDLLSFESEAQFDDQLTGSGFLALGPTNYELQDKQLLEMEVIDEQIDTLGRAFLGLTIGCARCHDHKFDPIPTADYYALAGIFRSTETLLAGNVSSPVTTNLKSGPDAKALTSWQKNEAQLKQKIANIKSQVPPAVPVAKFLDPASLRGIVIDDEDAVFEGDWKKSTMIAPFVGSGYWHSNFKSSGNRVRFEAHLPEGEYEVGLGHNYVNGRCERLPVSIRHANGTATVSINQSQRPEDGVFSELGTFRFAASSPAVVTIDAGQSGAGIIIVDAVRFVSTSEKDGTANERAEQRARKQLRLLQAELKEHQKNRPTAAKVISVRDSATPEDGHLHIRGAVRNRGAKVSRGFVTVAGEFNKNGQPVPRVIPPAASGRLELADWLVRSSNPLTARVFVNRVWQHVIGEGLVRTPDNFGKMGQRPTHPELLNFLAWSFRKDDQWSVKSLVRRIVCSRTFRMASDTETRSLLSDPSNRFLTRGFRRRLDAESIRDSLLLVSNQLDTGITGATIGKVAQYDNGYDHAAYSQNMRSVYVPFFRNSMLEIFDVFDVANPNLVNGRRNTSTLPSQALFMMNSPFVQNCARSAAEHFLVTRRSGQAALSNVTEVFTICLGRNPTDQEAQTLVRFVETNRAKPLEILEVIFQAMFSSLDFRFVD